MKNVITAVLMLMAISTSAFSATADLSNFGWVVTQQSSEGKVMKMTNMGLRIGQITIGCEKEGNPLEIHFTRNSKASNMFIVELDTASDKENINDVRVYGLQSLTPAIALNQFERTDRGFIVSFYADNAINQFYRYKAKEANVQIPVPIGAEKFAGHENVKVYTDQIRQVCTGRYMVPVL